MKSSYKFLALPLMALVFACSENAIQVDNKVVEEESKVQSSSSAKVSSKSSSSSKKTASSSSSSIKSEVKSSSSQKVDDKEESSSSAPATEIPADDIIIVESDFGSCAPVTADGSVEKGTPVAFKFTYKHVTDYAISDVGNATYKWNFQDAAVVEGTGGSNVSNDVIFASSGKKDVSVTVTVGKHVESVHCPVMVNGSPIVGCRCEPESETVDLATGGVATWSVTDCSSEANITGYKWEDDVDGEGSVGKFTFTESGETKAPQVTVYNDDNTAKLLTCSEVESIDSDHPEYLISSTMDYVELPAGESVIIMDLPPVDGVAPSHFIFACSMDNFGESVDELVVDGISATGRGYVSLHIPYTSTINRYPLTVIMPVPGECSVHW